MWLWVVGGGWGELNGSHHIGENGRYTRLNLLRWLKIDGCLCCVVGREGFLQTTRVSCVDGWLFQADVQVRTFGRFC